MLPAMCLPSLMGFEAFQCQLLVEASLLHVCAKCTVAKISGLGCAASGVLSFECRDFVCGAFLHRELSFPLVYSLVHVGVREWPHGMDAVGCGTPLRRFTVANSHIFSTQVSFLLGVVIDVGMCALKPRKGAPVPTCSRIKC